MRLSKYIKEDNFKVAIPKQYFKEPNKEKFTTVQDVVKIKAKTRIEAAEKAWKKYGKKWVKDIKDEIKIISLYVDDPKTKTLFNRLSTITVYKMESK